MKTKLILGIVAITFVLSCTAKKGTTQVKEDAPVAVAPETTKSSIVVTPAIFAEGKKLYGMNCAKCHKLYNSTDFTPDEWMPIVLRMQKKANITDEQREIIYAYLSTPEM